MTAMVEKVARAIATSRFGHDGWDDDDEGSQYWERCVDHARAAIEAMREPTETMTAAGMRRGIDWEYGKTGHPDNGPFLQSEASYIAMIKAALETTP